MKTEITDVTLVDLMVVAQSLAEKEIEQLEAFTGNAFDPEELAVKIYSSGGIKWTCRVIETGEPIVVAGFFQVGVSTWRSFMIPGDRTWAEFGAEVTEHTKEVIERVAGSDPYIRIETVCLEDHEDARKWYPSIGLEFESVLRSYGVNGENAVMYTQVGNGAESGVIERV